MSHLLETVLARGIVPVVVVRDAARAAGLGEALVAGDLPVAEVTLRTAAAVEAIATMAKNPDLVVGAGTVLTPQQVDLAVDAGARFLVSPGFSAATVARAAERGVPIVPGTVTPSEVMAALAAGLTTLKFFPASNYGGAGTLKAFSSVFSGARFVPTGGVSAANLGDYLALPNVPAVGGSWMVPADVIDAGDFAEVQRLCAAAVAAAA
ncbi:MAG: bifunctional 4-hydroxy-2-oxoglutarate aldolase/2-dehydro-3-deoxy-phosphogluconate aldolase, partial [Micropruina sp.]|uniref:bifunctional 4-hydroxy-2-oxoglutarate aldolase/2-dehydro-3-deoxy-phosphogluconate aldolase n=1 Tax=Micropruina sp. TaxID=2737536 RepID=UPI0039E3BA44